jgi:tetratricopeptide (TPR) repeat protein
MLSDRLCIDDPDAAEAAREIKAWLAAGETSKALITCNRMLSLRPDDRLFEGLRLEVENKAREIRMEFIRQLGAELEKVPDLDARVESIRQARLRYPSETSLSDLLENATGRRNLFNALIAEARNEEHTDQYARALGRWHLVQELFPMMPGLDEEIRRVESLAETQKKMKRRSEFVDAIFQLSSTGEYTRALYQCINALAEYPNDGGLLTLKKSIEEKAEHATELQKFVSDGLTFLQAHEIEAALECFGKAKAIDQNNLQVRYLIGIALLEKARLVMDADRRKLNLLLDEAKSFMPNQRELQSLSFESDGMSGNWEKALVRIELPATKPQQDPETPAITETTSPIPPEEPPPAPQPQNSLQAEPAPTRKDGASPKVALLGLVILGAVVIGWIIYANQSAVEKPPAVPSAQRVDIKATPAGTEIFIDGRKVGESQAQAQLTSGNHTVSASLAGYESRTLPLEVASEPKTVEIDLQPILMDVHVSTDQPDSIVWMDDQPKGAVTEQGITISGVEPGVRAIKIQTPGSEIELSFDFRPGKMPTPVSLPPRQIVNVLFAGSADGNLRVECNCAPAGLRVGDFAEMIRADGLELPLEGQRAAELWMGKSRRNLTIHGSRSPVATIALFSNPGTVGSPVEPGR